MILIIFAGLQSNLIRFDLVWFGEKGNLLNVCVSIHTPFLHDSRAMLNSHASMLNSHASKPREVCSALEVKMTSDKHIRRRVLMESNSMFSVFDTISDLVNREDQTKVNKVVIKKASSRTPGHDDLGDTLDKNTYANYTSKEEMVIESRISNVCGKITHVLPQYWKDVHHPYVIPSIRRSSNNFGRFDCLYSSKCNLLTSITRQFTLFRGGHCLKETLDVINAAILPETIYSNTVHMIVMSARLHWPIQTNSMQVKHGLEKDPRWKVRLVDTADDCDYKGNLMLFDFADDEWRHVAGLEEGSRAYFPSQIKILITKRGSINFFLTMNHFPLTEHELIMKHVGVMLSVIIEIVVKCT